MACGEALASGARFCASCGQPAQRSAVSNKADGSVLFVFPRALKNHRNQFDDLAKGMGAATLWVDADTALVAVQEQLRGAMAAKRDPSAVCLVGGSELLPHAHVVDRTGNDRRVLTDNFYGRGSSPSEEDRFCGDLLPDIPVSRIPFSRPADLVRTLKLGESLGGRWENAVAVSAAVWEDASLAVLERIAAGSEVRLRLSPPDTAERTRSYLAGSPERVYFNVHGSDQSTCWYGDGGGRMPEVLDAHAMSLTPGAVVVSEACYGALQHPGEPSVSASFLRGGAGAFVGSTIIAWDSPWAPPTLADLIAVGFYEGLDAGMGAASALLYAKQLVVNLALKEDGALDPQTHNTALAFVLYGSPTARVGGAKRTADGSAAASQKSSALERLRSRSSKSAGTPSALDRIRQGMRDGASGNSPLGRARQRVVERLPQGSWEFVSESLVELATVPNLPSLQRLLGGQPTKSRLLRYKSRGKERSCVLAERAGQILVKRVAVITDADGRVLREYVSH